MFETHLLQALERLDPGRPVVVEAEANKIGDLMLPPALWRVMQSAPRIELAAPRAERARYLVAAYRDIIADLDALEIAFQRLPVHPSQERLKDWRGWARQGAFEPLAEALMELHYDPAYARVRRKQDRPPLARIDLANLDEASQDQAVDQIAGIVATLAL
jgi:tRNA 2-selenouridine synthase